MISSTKAKPGEDHWLSSSANDILKGIIRSELRPFLTRLAAEGLWDAGAPFQKLPEEHRRWLLHGYWRRPGPGTFLKKGKDPSEVGSWLRWDGLVNHLAEQLPRSKDKDWRQALEASRRSIRCPECAGSGLAATADLIRLGDETLRNLITHGTAATLGSALRKLPRPKGDAARRYDIRLQKVLGVLKVAGKAKLEIGARDLKTNSKILQAMVDNLTTMSVV